MKKILYTFIVILLSVIYCSCGSDCNNANVETASPVTLETFESEITERISAREKFDVFSSDNVTAYIRPGLEYGVKHSDTGYIQSVAVTVLDVDTEFIDKLTYYSIKKPDNSLDDTKKASIDAIRYFAMPLTLLCGLSDTEAIDTVLEARTREITENGWRLTLVKGENTAEFNIAYTG